MVLNHRCQVLRHKIACENGVIRLMRTMQDTYDLVMTVDALPHLHKQKNVLEAIVQQTIECAFFIRDYVDTRDSCEFSRCNRVLADVGCHSRKLRK